jgi:hypothetical protein
MRYLKTYEDWSLTNLQDNEILDKILSIITSYKPKCYIHNHLFYVSRSRCEDGLFWIIYKYKAKSKVDRLSKLSLYEESKEKIISTLKQLPEVENVKIDYLGRNAKFSPDSKYSALQKPSECVYEVKCHIKKEFVDKIIEDFEIKNTAKQYNL